MTGGHFKLVEEYMSIAEVTVGSPLSWLIPKLFSDEQPLSNRTNAMVNITVIKVRMIRISQTKNMNLYG